MILADNVFNAAGREVLEDPALTEGIDNLRVRSALLLRSDDETDLCIRVFARAHHLDEQEQYWNGDSDREGGLAKGDD